VNDRADRPNEWPGYCAICEGGVVFRSYGPWHRDQLVCTACGSIPRQRALVSVLSVVKPDWRGLRIWEVAPAGPASDKLKMECDLYISSQFWPDVAPGTIIDGVRCEDIERPTLGDASVDIVISSDVFEHIIDVDAALAQVARVLGPEGVHIWTTPQYRKRDISAPRVRRSDSSLEYLVTPEYHGDPVNPDGALVTYDWGLDLPDRVAAVAGMWTTNFRLESRVHGLLGEFLEVFVSHRGPEARIAFDGGRSGLEPADDLGRIQDALLICRQTVLALQSSRSWRVTGPLRRLASAFRHERS
jgi:SAM-dependent methyltransferase